MREEYKGYGIEISQDEFVESPDGWYGDDLFLGEIRHPRYIMFGRKGWRAEPEEQMGGQEEPQEVDEYLAYPVRISSYNGEARLERCRWGKENGAIFVPALSDLERLAKEVSEQQLMESLLSAWNQYFSGDVWQFLIRKDGDIIDSCAGIYGSNECEQMAREVVDNLCKEVCCEEEVA